MKRFKGLFVGATALAIAVGGAAPAQADNLKGLTYEKAVEAINAWGAKAVVTARFGDYLPTEQCIVMSSSARGPGVFQLRLDCNDNVASANHAGKSLATPEGRQAKLYREQGDIVSQRFAEAVESGGESWCQKDPDGCRYLCNLAGNCSAEVLSFLGM